MTERSRTRQAPTSGETYEVGYGKPPREHQFKPKQSGNPKGRPKGAHSVSETITRHLDGTMTVRQGGKARRMKRREILVQKLFERALGGDNRAAALLLGNDKPTLSADCSDVSGQAPLSPKQSADIFELLKNRMKGEDR